MNFPLIEGIDNSRCIIVDYIDYIDCLPLNDRLSSIGHAGKRWARPHAFRRTHYPDVTEDTEVSWYGVDTFEENYRTALPLVGCNVNFSTVSKMKRVQGLTHTVRDRLSFLIQKWKGHLGSWKLHMQINVGMLNSNSNANRSRHSVIFPRAGK